MIPQANPVDGRVQRRLESMRRAQDAALQLFEKRGFDAVTVEDVARAADQGVASLFRNFGTKEALVLWDEYDPLLFESVSKHLATKSPLEALSAGVREALGSIYEHDRKRVLRRADLMATTPALMLASRANLHPLREGLSAVLASKVKDPLERELLGAVFGATLEVAVEHWRKEKGRRPLNTILQRAFTQVGKLGARARRRSRGETAVQ